jgi:hypothetical protein
MKAITLASACAALALAWSTASFSEPQLASAADGKAMLERAIAALKANEAAALKAFNDEKNKDFRDRDLYVYCFSLPYGNFTAYQSPVLIGTNIKELKIPPNDPVGQRAYDAVAKAAEGEIVTLTISPSLAPKPPRLRKRLKSASASRPAASAISSRRLFVIARSDGDEAIQFLAQAIRIASGAWPRRAGPVGWQ